MAAVESHEQVAARIRRKVMLVEDSALVIMSLEGLFDDMDWDIDGPATRLGDALALAETTDADIALLDVNLDGEMSWGVAERLRARGIPFVFATGYDSATVLPDHMQGEPIIGKPFAVSELETTLRGLVGE